MAHQRNPYFETFSGAVAHTKEVVRSRKFHGKTFIIDEQDWWQQICCGAGRPQEGETFSTSISLREIMNTGLEKESKKALHIQVYGMRNSYELNFYIL